MVRHKYQTIPPECQECGIIDWPEGGNPVDSYYENEPDPKWACWLCSMCRSHQWHETGDDETRSLQQFLGQSDLEHKYWVEGKWELFYEEYRKRIDC